MNREIFLSLQAAASPESVFQCFEDTHLMKQWIEGLVDFQYLDPPSDSPIGRRFRQTNLMGGRWVVYEGKIIAWDKPRQFAAEVNSSTFSYKMEFLLERQGTETAINYKGELFIRHRVWRLFGGLITYICRNVFAKELSRLKTVAEQ